MANNDSGPFMIVNDGYIDAEPSWLIDHSIRHVVRLIMIPLCFRGKIQMNETSIMDHIMDRSPGSMINPGMSAS